MSYQSRHERFQKLQEARAEAQAKQRNFYFVTAGVVGVGLIFFFPGCESQEVKDWENSPGTKGLINLRDVGQAFRQSKTSEDFEQRVNKIYEGDHLILLHLVNREKGFHISAREDLNDNDKYETEHDDLLFTLEYFKDQNKFQLIGHGVNQFYNQEGSHVIREEKPANTNSSGHYHSPGFFFFSHYSSYPYGHNYYTPVDRPTSNLRTDRKSYRDSSAYKRQVQSNVSYENYMNKRHGSRFRNSLNKTSPIRQRSISETKKASGFGDALAKKSKSSAWGQRSSSTARSFKSNAFSSSSKSSGWSGFRGSSGGLV